MRWVIAFCAAFWATVVALLPSCAHANTPSENEIAEIFIPMMTDAVMRGEVHFLGIGTRDTKFGESPVSMGNTDDTRACVLVLSVRDNPAWSDLLRLGHASHAIKVRTILAHELGHCAHAWYPNAPITYAINSHEAELFADAYALAWTHVHYPADFDDAFEYLHAIRAKYSRGNTFYPMPVELTSMRAVVEQSTDNPRETAMRILKGTK
jgi:hypothetical protein